MPTDEPLPRLPLFVLEVPTEEPRERVFEFPLPTDPEDLLSTVPDPLTLLLPLLVPELLFNPLLRVVIVLPERDLSVALLPLLDL